MNKYTGDYLLASIGCLFGMFLIIAGFLLFLKLTILSAAIGGLLVSIGGVLYCFSKHFYNLIREKEQKELKGE